MLVSSAQQSDSDLVSFDADERAGRGEGRARVQKDGGRVSVTAARGSLSGWAGGLRATKWPEGGHQLCERRGARGTLGGQEPSDEKGEREPSRTRRGWHCSDGSGAASV